MKQITTFLSAILLLIPLQHTHAQDKAMSHSGAQGASLAKGSSGSKMRYSKPTFLPIAKKPMASNAKNAETSDNKNSPENKIWEKYRALAGGQDPAPKAATIPVKKIKKTKDLKPQAKEEISPTGIAGIIAQYQANKQKRSQMRSLTIAKPAVEKEGDKKRESTDKE